MQIYFVYDKKTGQIVHMHRVIDIAGRSCSCTPEEVMRVLPEHVNPNAVGIASAKLDQVSSGRQMAYSVDVATGELIQISLDKK